MSGGPYSRQFKGRRTQGVHQRRGPLERGGADPNKRPGPFKKKNGPVGPRTESGTLLGIRPPSPLQRGPSRSGD